MKYREVQKENKRSKMVIVFSQIMKGFATKEEVAEEIEELIESEDNPYKTLRDNIESWAKWHLTESEADIIFLRIKKFQRYL